MPVTRSLMEKKRSSLRLVDQYSEVHAGEHIPGFVVGSRVSCKSSKLASESVVDRAKLRAESIKMNLEREAAEFQHNQKMKLMEAEHAVRLAEIAAQSSQHEESVLDDDQVDSEQKVVDYLSHCHEVTASNEKAVPDNERSNNLRISDLPKIELFTFDGTPSTYWKFFRQFETYVESRTTDESQRFLYLLHYCRGMAREAIEECVMLPQGIAYGQARSILKDLFGQPHVVARSMLDGLFKEFEATTCSSQRLSHLVIKMRNCEIALEQMHYTADLNSLMVLERLVKSLPFYMQQQWAENVDQCTKYGREPMFSDLTSFIASRARVANSRFGQLVEENRKNYRPATQQSNKGQISRNQHSFAQLLVNDVVKAQCCICGGAHLTVVCKKLLSETAVNRWKMVKQCKLCFRCLETGHVNSQCQTNKLCNVEGCKAGHHTLLHWERTVQPIRENKRVNKVNCGDVVAIGVLPVRLSGPKGFIEAYAFLDSGSDTTVMCHDVAMELGVEIRSRETRIKTLNGSLLAHDVIGKFELGSIDGLETIHIEKALVVEEIMPSAPLEARSTLAARWPHLNDIRFDETDNKRIAVLVGCDVPEAHWAFEQRIGARKQPYAVKTLLGWVILGPINPRNSKHSYANFLAAEDSEIARLLNRMYNNEFGDASDLNKALSLEDARVADLMDRETKLINGHYVVPLPWKQPFVAPAINRSAALWRLKGLKKKLQRDPLLYEKYVLSMEQNFVKHYAQEVRNGHHDGSAPVWYLPHHAVFNQKKPGKIRVVFDCAAKFQGVSLNDLLCQGPDMTANLVNVLLKFRKGRIAVSADIEEMFMQVRVAESDRKALRFLWWPSGNMQIEPKVYEMNSHPFGATSSPYCANYALRRAVADFGNDYDAEIGQVVLNEFYVDDCLTSFDTLSAAKNFVVQCKELLERGGFRLRKWVSNNSNVLAQVPESELAAPLVTVPANDVVPQRALGLLWDSTSDVFVFKFDLPDRPMTRRGILSSVSSFYDPLGLLSPLCLPPKQLLQKLCKSGLGWDQPIGSSELKSWQNWLSLAKSFDNISVQRCIQPSGRELPNEKELHIFADASESGYGVVAYVKYIFEDARPYCTILMGKSRVAPLKTVTIPRLELAAAVLAVRVAENMKMTLSNYFTRTQFWTDSKIVLHYINNKTSSFATFVANRLAVIHRYTMPEEWSHVKSEDNLADLASRGLKNEHDLYRWLTGPNYNSERVASSNEDDLLPTDFIEYKRINAITSSFPGHFYRYLFEYHSNWSKLLKCVAWFDRFMEYFMFKRHRGSPPPQGTLTVFELRKAQNKVIRAVQRESFAKELTTLKTAKHHKLFKTSPLAKLNPIMSDGLLCVGGRLAYASCPEVTRHQIILPAKHEVTKLLISHSHEVEGHTGVSHILSILRRQFWILSGCTAVKRVIGSCLSCRRRRARQCQQIMSPLPSARVEKGLRCFESVGIDYFGPFLVKRGRSMEKRYGCLFTCLKARAVHIEVAHDLSTDTFIMAMMRFIARRGRPREVFSDNGTNFVGTIREMKEHVNRWDQHKISDHLSSRSIQWHFNPPECSHRGGVWERMVRSVRSILCSIVNQQTLTDGSISTFFCEAERILNDRPMYPPSSDSRDSGPLTPNHLLLLESNVGIPSDCSLRERYTRRWKQINYLCEVFWSRWLKEYLPTLQLRQKWLKSHRNLKNGDLVLITSEQNPREKWPLGLVTDSECDADGFVRTVVVRTSNGTYTRDVRKICLLEGVG